MRYKIFGNFPPEVSFVFNFAPQFLEFSVEWFAFRKFNSFSAFLEIFPGQFGYHLFSSKCWWNGKRPQFSKYNQVTSHLFLIRVVRDGPLENLWGGGGGGGRSTKKKFAHGKI